MDLRDLRTCFGRFATGVTVVTCQAPGRKHGFTVNSFTSVSLDPPLILISVDKKTKACEYLRDNNFAINILRADQEDMAVHFAGRAQRHLLLNPEKIWKEGEITPVLQRSLACIECHPWKVYDGGDHVLYIGEVKRYHYGQGQALGFYKGKFFPVPEPTAVT